MVAAAALSLVSMACSRPSIDPPPQPQAAAGLLTGKQLRRLLSDTNTYLMPSQIGDIIVDHPSGELFRQNGTYRRMMGRAGLEGTFAVEGDLRCVVGPGIPRKCRSLSRQRGNTYLLVDNSDHSRALVDLSQRK